LQKAEIGEKSTADKDYEARLYEIVESLDLAPDRKERLLSLRKEALLHEIVDNVGRLGRAGQACHSVCVAQRAVPQTHPADAYAKNHHLNLHVHYLWNGSKRRYVPDFLVRLANGKMLVLELKGQDTPQDGKKRLALADWTKAVNRRGGFDLWCDDVVFEMAQVRDVLERHAASEPQPA